MTLVIATCQFPVDSDIACNKRHVVQQLTTAKQRGAHVAHFPEGALSGYAGVDFDNFKDFDWQLLNESMRLIQQQSRELSIWVVLGSSHRLTGTCRPHNCVYIINDLGEIVDRYDKRFCAGNREGTQGELVHYSPGNHSSLFEINGTHCGALICHEYRYPELFREYKRLGIQVLFHSFHAGNIPTEQWERMRQEVGAEFHKLNNGSTLPEITMPAAMHSAAADNYFWISCSNTSARESCWPSFAVRPDGVIVGRLRRNVAGVLCTEVDLSKQYYDSTAPWRDRAMRGLLHSGSAVKDKRSDDRTSL